MRRGPCGPNQGGSMETQSEIDWTLRHATGRYHALGNRSRPVRTCNRHKRKKTPLKGLLDKGAVLSMIPIETQRRMGFDTQDLIDSKMMPDTASRTCNDSSTLKEQVKVEKLDQS